MVVQIKVKEILMIRISLTFIFYSIVVGFALMPNSVKLFYQFIKYNDQIEPP